MFEVLNLVATEACRTAKSQIDCKLKSIKEAADWTSVEVDEIVSRFDVTDLYKFKELNENANWSHIAKLSVDLYLDYDYFKQFIFSNRERGHGYDYRLRMLGYVERDGYWTSVRRPETELVVENIFISCLYRSIETRLTVGQRGPDGRSDADGTDETAGKCATEASVNMCPFCDLSLAVDERECSRCGANEQDFVSMNRQTQAPVDNRAGQPLTEQVDSNSMSLDRNILMGSCQPEAVIAPLPSDDQNPTDNISDDRVSISPMTGRIRWFTAKEVRKRVNRDDDIDENSLAKRRKCDISKDDVETGESPDQLDAASIVSRKSCAAPKTAIEWTCRLCQTNNEISRTQCVSCEATRYCTLCETNQDINEKLCSECLALRWRCWHRLCRHSNFGNNEYCGKCGLARHGPDESGKPVWQKIGGSTARRLVWMCDTCKRINTNNRRSCFNYDCQATRNSRFIWCRQCGWGTRRVIWDMMLPRRCGQCNEIISIYL